VAHCAPGEAIVGQRAPIEQLLDCQTPCIGVGRPASPKFLVALVEMLRQLFDNHRLTRRVE
jgi:hypothetical protein